MRRLVDAGGARGDERHGSPAPAAARPRRLGYRPALDTVRGVAWLVVFSAHASLLHPFAAGQVCMFVFFALSGFLITELLVEEHAATTGVSLRNFFARRALRLLPALFLFVGCWLVVVLATWGHAPWTGTVPGGGHGPGTQPLAALEGAGAALFYTMNWANIFHAFTSYVPIGHLWSLAVEEQFYLLWAPVAALCLRRGGRRTAGGVAALLAAASFVDVLVLRNAHGIRLPIDMGTDTRAGAFLVGAALAPVWFRGGRLVERLGRHVQAILVAGSLGLLTWTAYVFSHHASHARFALAWVGVSVASGLLVLVLVSRPRRRATRLSPVRVLTYLGRRSYALYLWHYVWLTWFRQLGHLGIGLAFVASLLSAEASWQLVERRALARKARFTPPRQTPSEPAPAPSGALAGSSARS